MKLTARYLIAIILGSLGVTAISVYYGFKVDGEAFRGHLAGEAAGFGVSVLAGVLLVDRGLEKHRQQRWSVVAKPTSDTVLLTLVRLGHSFYLTLPIPRPPTGNTLALGHAGPTGLKVALVTLAKTFEKIPSSEVQLDVEFVETIRDQLDTLRQVVMPRLLALDEHERAGTLAAVEASYQSLEHAAWQAARLPNDRETKRTATQLLWDLAKVAEAFQ